ncbi:glycosyltransferase family 2 protein [Aquimarina sp. 2201CG14-23]|uniref:glycosyltransferase family 2 protein n=1 Tax=Aquimarina mycalae TaxID=3040073 RepID=UPI0024781003|nr:glycosyltransferase family 2 protein [Aquimarina sp. 2201CG14-23]MDH7446366.1 glycosyltransferase family 2 protein [Aquimarina sp. 2201CG14-23]
MQIPKTYIILLNYKSWKDTIECLESVLKLQGDSFQIILVDNSPTNESIDNIISWANGKIENIKTDFPELVYPLEKKPIEYVLASEKNAEEAVFEDKKLIIIKSNENNGFSAGNNVGLRYVLNVSNSSGKVWLLNNDTVVSKNTLSKLLETSESNSKYGIIGAKLIEYDNPKIIQSIGGKYNPWIGKISIVGNGDSVNKKYSKEVTFDYPIGASMFLDIDFVRKVGLMDEQYFLYFEEYDWVLRGKRNGYEMCFCPEAEVYHKGGGSSGGKTSKLSDFYGIRSKILFTKKFFPLLTPILYLSFLFFLFNRIKRKQYDRIFMLFKLIKNPNSYFNGTDNK